MRVLDVLARLDRDLLADCGCFFGGGTAVSLRCGEPRVSRDVDFLCASHDGYRELRQRVFGKDARALFVREIEPVRELRADRYGIRTVVRSGETVVKLEIVSEGRIDLGCADDPELPVLRLSDVDLVAEKLLANADRGLDDATLHRDAIDLALLHDTLGGLPQSAFEKARGAYGDAIDRAYVSVTTRLREDAVLLARCFDGLGVTEGGRARVERVLREV